MKTLHFVSVIILMLLFTINLSSQEDNVFVKSVSIDKVQALKDTLAQMAKQTNNELFINHCKSFIKVIDAQTVLSRQDSNLLIATYDTFCSRNVANCRKLTSYLNRQRSFIFAWQSPTDSKISLAWVTLPKDWNPYNTYPLYVHLHGLSSNYGLPINFLTRSFLRGASTTYAYEDGYWLSPWGRGNLWYLGISETDVWESINELEKLVNIDLKRQYLTGHSMGGYGSWYIASRSAEKWAALGVEAGALGYNNDNLLKNEYVQQLTDLPTYFVCGTRDELLSTDQKAFNLLTQAGNFQTKFVTFEGAHEHLNSNDEDLYLWMKEFVNENYTNVSKTNIEETNSISCFPNPFNEYVNITFHLKTNSLVNIAIYNFQGKLVKSIENCILKKGEYFYRYAPTASGIYFCRYEIENKLIGGNILIFSK